jgi:hypothetical protein
LAATSIVRADLQRLLENRHDTTLGIQKEEASKVDEGEVSLRHVPTLQMHRMPNDLAFRLQVTMRLWLSLSGVFT